MSKKQLAALIGRRVKTLRELAGLTQIELARRAKLDSTGICRLESGQNLPSVNTLYKISQALKTDPSKLLEESP